MREAVRVAAQVAEHWRLQVGEEVVDGRARHLPPHRGAPDALCQGEGRSGPPGFLLRQHLERPLRRCVGKLMCPPSLTLKG